MFGLRKVKKRRKKTRAERKFSKYDPRRKRTMAEVERIVATKVLKNKSQRWKQHIT